MAGRSTSGRFDISKNKCLMPTASTVNNSRKLNIISHILYLISYISYLISLILYLLSYISYLISLISYLSRQLSTLYSLLSTLYPLLPLLFLPFHSFFIKYVAEKFAKRENFM